MSDIKLPPLPETVYGLFYEAPSRPGDDDEGYQELFDEPGYTADQMKVYARAAIEAQRVPDGWRPIETAPKTSRSILVHCAERKNTYTVTWGRDVEFPWWEHFSGGSLNESPTHWMPLPAAPGSAAPPVAQPGIPLEDSIAWQAGAFNPLNPKTAVTVEGHAWYRHDHPKVTQAKPEQAQPAERKPLTNEQKEAVMQAASEAMDKDPNLSWRMALVAETERACGIGD